MSSASLSAAAAVEGQRRSMTSASTREDFARTTTVQCKITLMFNSVTNSETMRGAFGSQS